MMVAIVADDDDGRGLEGCPDLPDVDVVKDAGVVLPSGCCCQPPPPSSPSSSSLFHGRPPLVEASMVAIVILAVVGIDRPSSSIEPVDAVGGDDRWLRQVVEWWVANLRQQRGGGDCSASAHTFTEGLM
ncbi:hypothetical protein Dimus_035557 [Dionaea muscipula]